MTADIVTLNPKDRLHRDPQPIDRLYREMGTNAAENAVNRAVGELALALSRWIIDNERYDERYLRAPGAQAAEEIGEPTWSDATHLVKVDDPKRQPLTMVDLGLADPPEPTPDGKPGEAERAVLVGGEPQGADTTGDLADLEVDTEVEGADGPIRVRSVFSLVKERVREQEIADYADAAGVDVRTIEQIARDFTSHGKQAAVMSYRGPAMQAVPRSGCSS